MQPVTSGSQHFRFLDELGLEREDWWTGAPENLCSWVTMVAGLQRDWGPIDYAGESRGGLIEWFLDPEHRRLWAMRYTGTDTGDGDKFPGIPNFTESPPAKAPTG